LHVIIIDSQVVRDSEGRYTLEIQFVSYNNPTYASVQFDGACCDDNNSPPNCRNRCETYLYICLRATDSPLNITVPVLPQDCPFGYLETANLVSVGNSEAITLGTTLDNVGNINPAEFPNNQPWPVST